jgi:predicted  nucleic acid-binding Zn-ribbon protein
LQNKLAATENKVIELTNEIEALKVSHDAAIVELNNIIDNYKQKEQELIESFDNRVADEVNTRIANLGIDTELPDASNEISEIDFSNCKSISDYWKQLGY